MYTEPVWKLILSWYTHSLLICNGCTIGPVVLVTKVLYVVNINVYSMTLKINVDAAG